MSLAAEILRPFWLPGVHDVTGKPGKGIAAWVTGEDYQIYTPLQPDTAQVSFPVPAPLVAALAADANRMAAAAIETVAGIELSVDLPKSLGWPLIRSYYAAYFAGHALLRLFGRTCTQLDTGQLASIHTVADLFGYRSGVSLTRGQYGGVLDVAGKTIVFQKRAGTEGGSHAVMWGMLVELLRDLSKQILSGPAASVPAQRVATKLIEIEGGLTDRGGNTSGSWLSQIRNRANYQLAFGAWFPYGGRARYYDSLFSVSANWYADPMDISMWMQAGRDLQRYLELCTVLVALCRVLLMDMAARCTHGTSMHRLGALALLQQLKRRSSAVVA
jgi:hypothetical protein